MADHGEAGGVGGGGCEADAGGVAAEELTIIEPNMQIGIRLEMCGSGEGKTVCVTGASGCIASWVVKLLLARGYTVKASVRDPSNHRFHILLVQFWIFTYYCFFQILWLSFVVCVGVVGGPDDPRKTNHLRALDGAEERLRLFKADLLERSFDAAIDGCDGVFRTASPLKLPVTDPQVLIGKESFFLSFILSCFFLFRASN